MIVLRYSSAGLAHSAAELKTEQTGNQWRMVFRPRALRDIAPFMIEEVLDV